MQYPVTKIDDGVDLNPIKRCIYDSCSKQSATKLSSNDAKYKQNHEMILDFHHQGKEAAKSLLNKVCSSLDTIASTNSLQAKNHRS